MAESENAVKIVDFDLPKGGKQNLQSERNLGSSNTQTLRSKLTYDDDDILKQQEEFMKEKYVRQKRTRPSQPKQEEKPKPTEPPPKFVIGNVVERTTKRRKIQPPGASSRAFPEVFQRKKDLDRKYKRKKHRSIFAMQMNKGKMGDSIESGKQMFKEQKAKNKAQDVDGSFISSIAGVSLQEANDIGSKNDDLLSGMSEEDILALREQLLGSLDPSLLEFVSKKGAEKPEQTFETPATCVPIPSNAEKMDMDIEPSINALSARGINATMEEKMEWMQPVDKTELQRPVHPQFGDNPIEVKRFNFEGLICDPHQDIDVGEGLHHHGADPVRAGYTIREAFHFSQSTVTAQRILGLNLLTAIAKNAREGVFLEESNLILELYSELCVEITIFLALRNTNPNISLSGMQLLHALLYPREIDLERIDALESSYFGMKIFPKKPFGYNVKDAGTFEKDFLEACVKEQKLLQSLTHILQNNPQAVQLVLDVLLAVVNHSTSMCAIVLEFETLIELLVGSVESSWKILRILRICLSSSWETMKKWAKGGFLDSVKRFLLGGDQRMQVEALYLWRVSLDFGMDVDSYVSMFSTLIQTPANYKQSPMLFTRNVYSIQSSLLRILSNANQSVGGNTNAVSWTHVAKRVEACLGTLTNCKDRYCKSAADFIGIGGLFHFAADYFITLKDECLDDADLHAYAQTQSLSLAKKWFSSKSQLIEALLDVSPVEPPSKYGFDGPLFKNLPNPILPTRCGSTPTPFRIAQLDALHGLFRFAMALLHFNPATAPILTAHLLPRAVDLLPNLHSDVSQLTPQMKILKCQLWQNDFLVGFHVLLLWNALDASFCTIDSSHSSIIFSAVCSLLENAPCGFSDFTAVLLHEFLDNELLLEALYMRSSGKLTNDHISYMAPDLPTIASGLSKLYSPTFKHTIDLKECRALHTFNSNEVKSLFVRMKDVSSCWILSPLLQKSPANLVELRECIHCVNLLCLAEVPYALSLSPWHIFMGVLRIFKRTIVVFGDEALAPELTLMMRRIGDQMTSTELDPDKKVIRDYESIFATYANESMAHPLFGSLLLIPLSNEKFQEIFWKKCQVIRRFQPAFLPITISKILAASISKRAYESMVRALSASNITKEQTPILYALSVARLSTHIFSENDKVALKDLKREASFECFMDVCAFEAEGMKLDAEIEANKVCDLLQLGNAEIPDSRMEFITLTVGKVDSAHEICI